MAVPSSSFQVVEAFPKSEGHEMVCFLHSIYIYMVCIMDNTLAAIGRMLLKFVAGYHLLA